jgi:pyruvate/2-oxoglutarate dehydrogenase complex dihydrolipoamide acyltransferase (E2) component
MKRSGGTVGLTSVGMFGTRSGWGLGMPVHSLAVMVGGIAQKPGVVDGRIEAREYLDLTLSFDHNIVDGAPAARFAQKCADLIESGWLTG